MNVKWSDERVAEMLRLRDAGKTPAEIAAAMGGITENAVVGKLYRVRTMKTAPAPEVVSAPAAVGHEGVVDTVTNIHEGLPTTSAVETDTLAGRPSTSSPAPSPHIHSSTEQLLSLKVLPEDLAFGMCKWPLGDPATSEFRYCGAPAVAKKSYCSHHYSVAYQSPSIRRPRRIEAVARPQPLIQGW